MNIFSGDKNYLGMLAIPVILFAVIASSNDLIDEKNVSEDKSHHNNRMAGIERAFQRSEIFADKRTF